MENIDLEKLKQWLLMRSEEMGQYDDEDGWSYGQKFGYEWVYSILTDEEEYKNMINSVDNEL